jgi:hypothetical protein
MLDFPRNLNASRSFQNEEAKSDATVDIASILKDFKATPTILKDVSARVSIISLTCSDRIHFLCRGPWASLIS